MSDLINVLSWYGQTEQDSLYNGIYDLNNDNIIDLEDVKILKEIVGPVEFNKYILDKFVER